MKRFEAKNKSRRQMLRDLRFSVLPCDEHYSTMPIYIIYPNAVVKASPLYTVSVPA